MMTAERAAGRGATARRGDAAAAGRSGRRRKTSGRSKGPRVAALQPKGAMQRRNAGLCNRGDDLGTTAWTVCHTSYGPTGRRSSDTRVGAAIGTAWDHDAHMFEFHSHFLRGT